MQVAGDCSFRVKFIRSFHLNRGARGALGARVGGLGALGAPPRTAGAVGMLGLPAAGTRLRGGRRLEAAVARINRRINPPPFRILVLCISSPSLDREASVQPSAAFAHPASSS